MKLQDLFENTENVDIAHRKLTDMIEISQQMDWGITIRSDFYCHDNKLTTLEGCPENIMGVFNCSKNNLKSLEFCPLSVKKSFIAKNNEIETVEFMPKYVKGDLDLSNNNIKSLEGIDKVLHHLEGKIILTGNPIKKGLGSLVRVDGINEVVFQTSDQQARLAFQKLNNWLMKNESISVFESLYVEFKFYGLESFL